MILGEKWAVRRRIALCGLIMSLLTAFNQQNLVVYAKETPSETTIDVLAAELAISFEAITVSGNDPVVAIQLGDFDISYYCCEKRPHICGTGTGKTASGRLATAGVSVAVDPTVIPLDSRVFVDFGDGEGWHEYSADDVGSQVADNHLDIAVETHKEALSQSKRAGRVCFIPPT